LKIKVAPFIAHFRSIFGQTHAFLIAQRARYDKFCFSARLRKGSQHEGAVLFTHGIFPDAHAKNNCTLVGLPFYIKGGEDGNTAFLRFQRKYFPSSIFTIRRSHIISTAMKNELRHLL